jgi:hypothetical protein
MTRGAVLSKFVGVRCTVEELDRLDDLRRTRGIENRSDALRTLVREATARPVEASPLPVTQQREVQALVDDGFARNEGEALSALVSLGLREFRRIHVEDTRALHDAAREQQDRAKARQAADREGRDRLER